MNVNIEKMTVEVDLMDNCLYVVKNGQLIKIDAPPSGHGKQTAIWKDGVVIDVLKEERQRII